MPSYQFQIPVPEGKFIVTLFTMSSGLDDITALVNGEDVSTQVIPVAHTASFPMRYFLRYFLRYLMRLSSLWTQLPLTQDIVKWFSALFLLQSFLYDDMTYVTRQKPSQSQTQSYVKRMTPLVQQEDERGKKIIYTRPT